MLIRTAIILSCTSLFMLGCQQGSSAPQATSSGDVKFSSNAAFAITTQVATDCTFNGVLVPDGTSTAAYQNSSVPYGSSCVSEQRTCTSGLLSGSYNYSSCVVDAPASCLFNGQVIPDGGSIEAYPNSSVGLGVECIFEIRTCSNGVLSGSNPYATCSINIPQSCLFNGQTINSGGSVNAYLSSSVPFGQQCTIETRYCVDGTLSGSNQFASCVVDQPASCLFNGQTVADGQTVTAFLNSSVAAGSSCQSESRTCSNGVLSGSNQYASCVIDQPASCLFNGQTVVDGSSVTAYLTSSTSFGGLCIAEERFCTNGQLAGSYQYASCSIDQPASCLFNGQTIAHGASVTAYATSTVSFGNTCSSEVRICNNGVLSGSNSYGSCSTNAPASCLFNGQTIVSGQSVVAYQSATVPNGQLCTSETQVCTNGILSGTFTNVSCSIDASKQEDDDDKDKDKICNKEKVDKKNHDDKDENGRDEKLANGTDNGLHLGWFKEKHREHFDCGKHLGWYKDKKVRKNTCNSSDKNKKK